MPTFLGTWRNLQPLDDFLIDRRRNGFAMGLQALQINFYSLPDVLQRLGSGLPLRNASGQSGRFRDKDPVFVLLDDDRELDRLGFPRRLLHEENYNTRRHEVRLEISDK